MYTSLTSPGECAPCLFTFFYHRDNSELIATMIPILQSLRLICYTFYKNLLWIFITHPWIEINGHLARQLISLTREKKRQQRTTWFGGHWLVHNYIHSADFLFVFRGSVSQARGTIKWLQFYANQQLAQEIYNSFLINSKRFFNISQR